MSLILLTMCFMELKAVCTLFLKKELHSLTSVELMKLDYFYYIKSLF